MTEYYKAAGLLEPLEQLGFGVVGYGCTTCIGNSGPLDAEVAAGDRGQRPRRGGRAVGQPQLRGPHPSRWRGPATWPRRRSSSRSRWPARSRSTCSTSRWARARDGQPVFLADIWPTPEEVSDRSPRPSRRTSSGASTRASSTATSAGGRCPCPSAADRYAGTRRRPTSRGRPSSTASTREPAPVDDIVGARVLAVLGDSVTTDHISPAGSIPAWSPAGQWLQEHGVAPLEFNSYGARRGHHEVMMRGTFGNIRLRNALRREGRAVHDPPAERRARCSSTTRRCATSARACRCWSSAGREYGSGSSRDWAAKGTTLLGVRAVLAESYERIHRSNLVGMGVLPLQFHARPERAVAGPRPGARSSTSLGLAEGLRAAPDRRRVRRARRQGRADASTSSAASTARSSSTTTARAASCRPCCAGSPARARPEGPVD